MVKIDDENYKEIIYSNPHIYEILKNAETFIKINYFTIPKYVEEERIAVLFKIAPSEAGEKKQVELLYLADITTMNSKVIGDITKEETTLLGYPSKQIYLQKLERRLKGFDAQRLCIVTAFKKVKNLEDFMED